MSPETRDRLNFVLGIFRTSFQYFYIPTIIYLGIKKGADPGCPEVTIYSLLWQ
uniref:Mitochondrial import receptor subunit TOM7 homolog n=1 Tax=Triatoma matogrossensis TaxID=162370 RepID=E2J7F8_9HEMI